MIVDRVRGQGQGVKTPFSPASSLAPLSPKYIAQRAKDPDLSAETAPSRSNLTRHGDMLDALQVRLSGTKVSVYISGAQLDKAIWTNQTRPWVNISSDEATRLREFIASKVKSKL